MADENPPEKQQHGRWGFLGHPFVIAALSSITAIIVAVVTLSSQSDSAPDPKPPNTQGVAFRVEPDFESYEAGWRVAFDGPLPDTAQYPDGPAADYVSKVKWAKTRGGIDIGESHQRLYLQNKGTERVTIRAVSAQVTERLDPLAQTYMEAPSAGLNEIIHLEFDLDSGDVVPAIKGTAAGSAPSAGAKPFFSTRNVTLDPGETTDFRLTAKSAHCLCRYRFELEIVKVDSTLKLEVGDSAGRPFAITGPAQSYVDRWMDGWLACQRPSIVRTEADGTADCKSRP